jgi:hypothetical protein
MIASEIQLSAKLVPMEQWEDVDKNLDLALVMINSGVVQEASYHLTQALSHVTTIGQRSMSRLLEKGLL